MKLGTSIVFFAAVAAFSIAPLCYAAPSCCGGQPAGTVGGISMPQRGIASPPVAPQIAWNGTQRPVQAAAPGTVRRWVAPAAAAHYVTPIEYGQPYAAPVANCCPQPSGANPVPSAGCCGGARLAQPVPAAGCCGPAAGLQAQRQGGCCGSYNAAQGTPAGSCCRPGAVPQLAPRGGCCGGAQASCGCGRGKAAQRQGTAAPSSLPPCCVPGTGDNKPVAVPAAGASGSAMPYRVGPVRQGSSIAVMNVSAPSQAEAVRRVGRPWPQVTNTLW